MMQNWWVGIREGILPQSPAKALVANVDTTGPAPKSERPDSPFSSIFASHEETLKRGVQMYVQAVEAALGHWASSAALDVSTAGDTFSAAVVAALADHERRIAAAHVTTFESFFESFSESSRKASQTYAAVATERLVKDLESDVGRNCVPSQTIMAFPHSVPTHSRYTHDTDMEMTAMSARGFQQLPNELSREIFMLAAEAGSMGELATLCRVCKAFHSWGTPFLYEAPFLSSSEQIALFAATLSQTPRLCALVYDLWMFLAEKPKPPKSPMSSHMKCTHTYYSAPDELSDEEPEDPEWQPASKTRSELDTDDSDIEAEIDPDDPTPFSTFISGTSPRIPDDSVRGSASGGAMQRYEFSLTAATRTASWFIPTPPTSWAVKHLQGVVNTASYVHAHALAILSLCTSLQRLHLPSFADGLCACLAALPPRWLTELTLYSPNDNTLFEALRHNESFTSVTKLTILGYPRIQEHLSDYFPNLTHLRIPLCTNATTLSAIVSQEQLTHLWFTPSITAMEDGHMSLTSFLLALPKTLKGVVRMECILQALPDEFTKVYWDAELFSFVTVDLRRDSDLSWIGKNMWVDKKVGRAEKVEDDNRGEDDMNDVDMMEDTDSEDSEVPPDLLSNVYTDRLRYYWTLRNIDSCWNDSGPSRVGS